MQHVTRIALPILGAGLLLLAGAFACGVWFAPRFYVHRSPVDISESLVLINPPAEGSIFTAEAYEAVNQVIEDYLVGELVSSNYPDIKPHYIVVPREGGYATYRWLENPRIDFPESLVTECDDLLQRHFWGESNSQQTEPNKPNKSEEPTPNPPSD